MQLVSVRRPEIATAVRNALAGVGVPALPVTLRFWDGSVLEGDAPLVEVRDPAALAYVLQSPNQIGLARAWVTGAVDVPDDDDLEAILRLRGTFGISFSKLDVVRLAMVALRVAGPALLRKAPTPAIEAPRKGPLHSLT